MYKDNHAAFWSSSLSPEENRNMVADNRPLYVYVDNPLKISRFLLQ
jgi:hypothetical protein